MSKKQSVRTGRQRTRLALLRLFAASTAPIFSPPIPDPASPVSHILVIRPDHLGDLLFTTPALRALRRAFPQARITAMVGPWGKPVLDNNPHLDDVRLCPFPAFTRRPKKSPLAPYALAWQTARQLRGEGYDLALVLRFDHWWGALVAYLARIPRRLGYDVAEVRPFLSEAVPYVRGRHEVQQNMALVREAGGEGQEPISPASEPLEFHPTAEDEVFAGRWLAGQGMAEGDVLIGIHPGAGAAVKLWRNQAWAEVGDTLARQHGARVVLTGSAGERALAEDVARRMATTPLLAAGETTLGQLAALLARCRLVLGPDCGPLHLAVALGRPTVHLYGPVDARIFGPWGDPARHVVVTSDLPCIPCNRLDYGPEELGEHACVRDIGVEKTLEAANRAMGSEVRFSESPRLTPSG